MRGGPIIRVCGLLGTSYIPIITQTWSLLRRVTSYGIWGLLRVGLLVCRGRCRDQKLDLGEVGPILWTLSFAWKRWFWEEEVFIQRSKPQHPWWQQCVYVCWGVFLSQDLSLPFRAMYLMVCISPLLMPISTCKTASSKPTPYRFPLTPFSFSLFEKITCCLGLADTN